MRQNGEKLSPEEYREEVEFYLFENHADHCLGMAKLVEEHDRSVKKTDENFEVTWDVIKLWDNCPICLGDAANACASIANAPMPYSKERNETHEKR